jgi:hypothetical protein
VKKPLILIADDEIRLGKLVSDFLLNIPIKIVAVSIALVSGQRRHELVWISNSCLLDC